MIVRKSLFLLVLGLTGASGCRYSSSSADTLTTVEIHDRMPKCPLEHVQLGSPTIGLFIGISNYDDSAGVWSTPAHALSAAMFREPFVAATRAPRDGISIDLEHARMIDSKERDSSFVTFDDSGRMAMAQYGDDVVVVVTDDTTRELSIGARIVRGSLSSESIVAFLADGRIVRAGLDQGIEATIGRVSLNPEPTFAVGDLGRRFAVATSSAISIHDASRGFDLPEQLTSSNHCSQPPALHFDSSATRLVIGDCDSIRIHPIGSTSDQTFSGSIYLKDRPLAKTANVLAFRQDPNHVQVRSLDSGQTLLEIDLMNESAQLISIDDSGDSLAVQTESVVRVYRRRAGVSQIPLRHSVAQVNVQNATSLQFSPSGQSLGIINDKGEVVVWTTRAVAPIMRLALAIPAGAIALPNDQVIRVLDKASGLIEYPLSAPTYVSSDFRLLADLSLTPGTELFTSTEYSLTRIDGMSRLVQPYDEFWRDRLNKDGSWNLVGGGERVSSRRIMDSLAESLTNADEIATKHGIAFFVLYISAHGWTDSEGKAYVVPSDAKHDEPTTWISADSIIHRVAEFLDKSREDQNVRGALVVFDTCQHERSGIPFDAAGAPLRQAPENLYVVSSTTPGEYSWHWTAVTRIHGKREVLEEHRFGFPERPKPVPRGPVDRSLVSNMSAFPLAAKCAVSAFFEPFPEREWLFPLDWFDGTDQYMQELLSTVPEFAESRATQQLQVYAPETLWQYPIFVYRSDEY